VRKLGCVLAAVVLAACSSGGTGAGPSDTISPKVRDQLAVDAASLQPADLPGHWTPERATDVLSSTRDQIAQAADECLAVDDDGTTAVAIRELLSGQELGHIIARGRVESHGDASTLATGLDQVTSDGVKDCITRFATKLFSTGTIGDVTVTPSTVAGVGQQGGGFLFSIPVSFSELQFAIGADIVYARVDRYRSIATVITFDRVPDHALVTSALTNTVSRLPAK
jgi:hypothetical protein